MSIYDLFQTDAKKEVDGIRFVVGQNTDGTDIGFTLARAGGRNKAVDADVLKRTEPYRRQLQAGTLSEETAERLNVETFCAAILKGWDGVTNRKGEPIEYNFENAVQLMLDLPDLHNSLRAFANNMSNYREQVNEDDAKN